MIQTLSEQRTFEQMKLSDAVYQSIDQPISNSEKRHRLILRDCLGTLAVSLENSHGYGYAGDAAHRRMLDHMANGELYTSDDVYSPYPEYRDYAMQIRSIRPRLFIAPDPELQKVFTAYGDVLRATRDTDNNRESDSRHVTHVAALAIPYALREYPDLDPALIYSYLLIHDIVEWHVGDTPTLNITPAQKLLKDRREAEAANIFAQKFRRRYPKLVKLLDDYEELKDDESKFAKTFEKLDPGFTHFANGGTVIRELGVISPEKFWESHDKTTVRMSPYSKGFDKILEDRDTRAHLIEELMWPIPNETS